MRFLTAKTFLFVLLFIAIFLLPKSAPVAQEQESLEPAAEAPERAPKPSGLAEIISLATELSGRLTVLEKTVGEFDLTAVEKTFPGIAGGQKDLSLQLDKLKASRTYTYAQLVELRKAIRVQTRAVTRATKPLSEEISRLEALRREWLDEKKHWTDWQTFFLKDEPLDEIKSVFKTADETIDAALNLISEALKPLVAAQQRAGNVLAGLDAFVEEVNGLIVTLRGDVLLESSPPMFSPRYFSQFRTELWYELRRGPIGIQWPDLEFFERYGWLVFAQVSLSLLLIIFFLRHRHQLERVERWRFLAKRPFAAGICVGLYAVLPYYAAFPPTWLLTVSTVGGIAVARLLGTLIEESRKRKVLYALVVFLITIQLLQVLGLPRPLFRLYILSTSLIGVLLCLRQAAEAAGQAAPPLLTLTPRLGALVFAAALIAELGGYSSLSVYLIQSSIQTFGVILLAWLLMRLARGGLQWGLRSASLQKLGLGPKNTDVPLGRWALVIDALIGVITLCAVLMIWQVYESPIEAVKGLLSFGGTVGSQRITLGLVLTALALLYAAFLTSWTVQRLLTEQVLARRLLDVGARMSIARLVHYFIVFIGFLLALIALGLDFTKLTIVVSALGIGLGFGLQNMANNFISGLILLFERPVQVGDVVQINEIWGTVTKINIRSTVVQTFDNASLIIPNADMVSNQVTNWSFRDPRLRRIITVGVAYGSDTNLVRDTLIEAALNHPKVLKSIQPDVLFDDFGDNALIFRLRLWTTMDHFVQVETDVRFEIDRLFREKGIEIAFPQRDIHIRKTEGSNLDQ